jgi:hypothetical protein
MILRLPISSYCVVVFEETYPIFHLAVADWIMNAIALLGLEIGDDISCCYLPGPFDAARASSPMKKSKSSVPRFIDRCPPGPAPPVKYEGLLATAGRPDPELAAPPAALFVAMAVGNTKEGESLPAKPIHPFWSARVCGLSRDYAYRASKIQYRLEFKLALFITLCNISTEYEHEGKDVLVHDNGGSLRRHAGS